MLTADCSGSIFVNIGYIICEIIKIKKNTNGSMYQCLEVLIMLAYQN